MADTKKKSTTKYKFGQRELDMQDYIENIGYNVQNYLEDRRKNRGWTDEQVQEFSSAYNRLMGAFKQQLADGSNRFSTNDLGVINDSQGEFSNTDNDDIDPVGSQYYYNDKGERITTDDYNNLKDKKKKKYKTFNANRQVAEYFRIIGNKLKDVPKPETSKFDLNKHGFVAWWNKKYNPAGGEVNLTPFLDKDPVGTDGKRPVSNRAKMAAGWMNEYLDWLKDQDLDYSNYDQFKDYDTYSAKGRELAQKWNDGIWDSDDLIAGQAFGISNDFSNGFFTQDEKPNLTDQQREEIAAEKKAKEEQDKAEAIKKAHKEWVDQQVAAFNSSSSPYLEKNPYSVAMDSSHWYDSAGNLNQENFYSAWGKEFLGGDGKLNPQTLNNYMNSFVQNPFDPKYKNDIARNIVGLINAGMAEQISSGDMQGMYYIRSNSDEQYNRALIYDPSTNRMFYTFVGNVPSIWERRKQQYRIDHGETQANEKFYFEEGGIISMQTGGDFGNAFIQGRNAYVKDKATAAGMDVETYEARNRKPNGDKNALEQNNGFSSNDILRLTAIGTDLAAMGLSFTPAVGASAITGAAGTTQHLIADIAEDGFDWGDAGRAALSYGLDALGVIPGVAAATKTAKIIKTLKTFAPRLIAVVGTVGTLANAPTIIKSLNKLTTDEHLTVQDWQNVTSALTLAIGGTAAIGRKYHTAKGNANGLTNPPQAFNNVAVQVRKKGTRDVENIILTKSETEAARNAKSNEDLLKIIQKREGMADYELATRPSLMPRFQMLRANGKWQSPIYFGQTKPTLMQIKRDQRTGKIYAENGRWGADITKANLKGVSKGQHAAIQQRRADDVEIANLDVIKNAQKASAEHQKLLDNKDTLIAQQETVLNNAKAARDAYVAANPSAPSVADTRKKLQDMADALAGHPGATIRRNPELVGYNTKQTAADDILLGKANRKAGKELTRLKKDLADLQSQLSRARGKNRTPIKEQIAAKEQEIVNKTAERAKLKPNNQAAKDWLTRNNPTEYKNLIQQLVKAIRYERGLAPKDAMVKEAQANLDKLKGLTKTKGQTEAFQELKKMMDPKSSTIEFTIGPEGAERTVKRDWNDILKKYQITYKEGGKFTAVRKYETGNPIKNVQGQADWFTDMYSHQSMKTWLDRINLSNYENFNHLQDTWSDNLGKTQYDPDNPLQAKGEGTGLSTSVLNRQKEWDKTGTNAAIEAAVAAGKLVRNGGTKDNLQGHYQDGYFGAQEYLRHGGTSDSWIGHEDELNKLKESFKSRNLEYYKDAVSGMYKLRPLNSNGTPQNSNVSSDLSPESDDSQQQDDQVNQKGQFDQVRKFNIDPMIGSITHNAYANVVNDKMTNRQIDAMRKSLTLYDFKNNTKYLEGDFDSLMGGQQAAGQLMHLSSQPLTSDGNVQKSAYTDSVVKALDYIRQGNAANNQALKKSKDDIWQLKYNDKVINYDIAMKNRQSIDDLVDNIANVENAHDAKEFTNNDILWQEGMVEAKQEANKRKAMAEQFSLSDIKNDVKYNLSDYAKQSGLPLSQDEEEAWQAIISGDKTYSELGGDDKEAKARLQKAYMSASRKATEIESNKIRAYYNIPQFNYSSVRKITAEDWFKPKNEKGGTLELKNGSKIAIAKIRERSKDADRFYKTVKDKQDRIDKAIARVDKKMYRRRDPEKRRK